MTPQQLKAMKLALEALELLTGAWQTFDALDYGDNAITAIKEALAEHAMRETQRLGQEIEQEPVAWLLTDININSLQVDSIQRLIDRLKHALHTDLCVRINGQDEWFEADWLKHMVRVTPPQRTEQPAQRTWVGLTEQDLDYLCNLAYTGDEEFALAVQAKLMEKNA